MHPLTRAWKRCDEADPNPPPATQSDLPRAEPASPHSSGSSSDSHSSGSPNSSSSLSPTSGSKLSSGSQSILQDSSPESSRHSLVSFALPHQIRSIPMKRHSPLNPTSFRGPPLSRLRPQIRPGINPLTQESYRNGSLSAGSSSSGPRLPTYGNVFFPRSPSFAARSSASSTLGGSTISLLPEWKHESLLLTKDGVFIPFPSDLYLVDNEPMNADDMNFASDGKFQLRNYQISARGWSCIIAIVILISALLALFIIYPVFSFYPNNSNAVLSNSNLTDLVNNHRSIIHARNQEPLSCNRVDFRSGKYPSSILKAGVPEYEQSFSDEWEKEGRRFGPDQDETWVSLINDDASTTQKGHLILDQQAHLKMRVPHCLGNGGFISVSFATDVGKLQRAYWTGNWSAVKDDNEDGSDVTDVLRGPGVEQPVMVTLHIEFDGGVSPVAVDHVRFYSLREPYACQDDAPDVSVHLDLSKLML